MYIHHMYTPAHKHPLYGGGQGQPITPPYNIYTLHTHQPTDSLPMVGAENTQITPPPYIYTPYVCEVKVALSCPTLCDPMDRGAWQATSMGILQVRILEWVAMSSSRGSSQPRDRTQVSLIQENSLPSEPPEKPWELNDTIVKAWGALRAVPRLGSAWWKAAVIIINN